MGGWDPPPGCPEPLWRALERYQDKRLDASHWPRNDPPFDLDDPATVTRLKAAIKTLCNMPSDSTPDQIERRLEHLMRDA